MKIASVISYLFVTIDVAHSHFYQEAYQEIDQTIQRILQSIEQHDVIIRIQRYDIYDGAQRLLDVVTRNVATTCPSQILVSERIMRFGFQPRNLASSRSLLIYIYTSNNDINDVELNAMLNDINLIAYPKHMPKLLLIIGSNKGTLDGRRQLRYLWDQKLFDVIILEVSFHPQYSEPVFVAIHRFNGFNEDYSRVTVYEGDTDWYPNKLRNMYGGTFKVTFEEVRPYGTFENGTVGGLAKLFMNALSDTVNGTVVHTSDLQENDMTYNAEELVYENWHNMHAEHEHTVAIGDDRICALVPAMPAARIVDFWRIVIMIVMILFGLLLVAIIWCVSLIMNVSERFRDPLNMISLILGMTPLHVPRSLVEKILFIVVIMTMAQYTIIFQAELFEFEVEVKTRMSTFQELYDTGLKVVVPPVVYDELAATEGLSSEFMKNFIIKYENVIRHKDEKLDISKAYFTSEINAKLTETKLKLSDKQLFKLSDLCILPHYRVHRLQMRSPFKNEVNNVLLSLVESGFVEKYVNDFWEEKPKREKMSHVNYFVYVAFFVIIVGHAISFIVFLGEIIAGRILKRKHFSLSFSYCKSMKKLK